eukprot:1612713-Rhodomonas_salina.1
MSGTEPGYAPTSARCAGADTACANTGRRKSFVRRGAGAGASLWNCYAKSGTEEAACCPARFCKHKKQRAQCRECCGKNMCKHGR